MPTEDDVREASKRFYVALTRLVQGDAGPMSEVWAHGDDVTTMHPVGGLQVGWDEVRKSFEQVAGMASGGLVELKDQRVRASGDLAVETGVEKGQVELAGKPVKIEHRVTNVYARDGEGWKLTHHHTDVAPSMVDAIEGRPSSPPPPA